MIALDFTQWAALWYVGGMISGGLYSAGNVFLSAADAWDWIHLFRSYRGKVYTAAEIGSIREVSAK